ncbi:hypothetical protein H0W80_03225 [Candidatus Saccharibacteria bacterium]|nr:hypothetical protein [Candidatus Saccharibacteria bacterium]
MRNETLLKVIIAVFAIILIVLATFVYGNIQRSNQNKQKSTNNSNQTSVKTPDTIAQNQPNQSSQSGKSPTPTPTPAPSPASKPAPVVASPPAKANMPTTGAGDAVIPMTILSVLAYIVLKKRDLIVSKSQLR